MIRRAAILLTIVGLFGCTAEPGLSPLTEPAITEIPPGQTISIGSASLRGALRIERQTATVYGRYGKQGRLTLQTEAVLDVQKSQDAIEVNLLFTEGTTKSEGVDEASVGEIDVYRGLEGVALSYRRNLVSGQVRQSMVKNGRAANIGGQQIAKTGRLIAQSHIGATTLQQGQDAMEFSLSDFLSGLDPIASPSLAGTVAGRTVHEGREVVVVRLEDTPIHRGVSYRVSGIYLVDIFLGLPVSGHATIIGERDGRETIRLAISQRIEL